MLAFETNKKYGNRLDNLRDFDVRKFYRTFAGHVKLITTKNHIILEREHYKKSHLIFKKSVYGFRFCLKLFKSLVNQDKKLALDMQKED